MCAALHGLEAVISERGVKLVVVDSMAAITRAEFGGGMVGPESSFVCFVRCIWRGVCFTKEMMHLARGVLPRGKKDPDSQDAICLHREMHLRGAVTEEFKRS